MGYMYVSIWYAAVLKHNCIPKELGVSEKWDVRCVCVCVCLMAWLSIDKQAFNAVLQ